MAEDDAESDDVYDEDAVEEELEDDEMTPEEGGFMEGYEEDKSVVKCANCGHMLDLDKVLEEKIKGQNYRFCSKNCAESFNKKLPKSAAKK